jgi:hypothetical protein
MLCVDILVAGVTCPLNLLTASPGAAATTVSSSRVLRFNCRMHRCPSVWVIPRCGSRANTSTYRDLMETEGIIVIVLKISRVCEGGVSAIVDGCYPTR